MDSMELLIESPTPPFLNQAKPLLLEICNQVTENLKTLKWTVCIQADSLHPHAARSEIEPSLFSAFQRWVPPNFDSSIAWSLRKNGVFAGVMTQVIHKRGIGCWRGKRVPVADRRQFLRNMWTMAIKNRTTISLDLDLACAFVIRQHDCKLAWRVILCLMRPSA